MISKLRYGNTNIFFVQGIGVSLLVDTDFVGTLPAFYRTIKEHNIKISDISYILATHYHPEHIGLVSKLIKQCVQLLLIDTQISHIHFSDDIFRRDKRLEYEPIKYLDTYDNNIKIMTTRQTQHHKLKKYAKESVASRQVPLIMIKYRQGCI